ncbi:MAG: hypothetical protein ACYDEN_01755 [Acidimicrobiales bacterium]
MVSVAALRLLRALRPAAPAWTMAVGLAGVTVLQPLVGSVRILFHPEDLVAVGFVPLAIERTIRRRPAPSGWQRPC